MAAGDPSIDRPRNEYCTRSIVTMPQSQEAALQRLIDQAEIRDVMCRYARGVDRGDWALLRSTYHPDAYDDHVGYKGPVDGLIEWLDERFADVDNSVHFLGNCL